MALGSTYHKKSSPPMAVSTSLEGLEIGVPPPKRSAPWLEKPLPKLPGRTSSMGSEDSGGGIVLVDYHSHNYHDVHHNHHDDHATARKRAQSESPEPSGRFYRRRNIAHRNSVVRTQEGGSLSFKNLLAEEPYGVGTHLSKANHYFREKKWDIFPELAPPQSQSISPISSTTSNSTHKSSRRNITGPKPPRGLSRQQFYHEGEVFGINLKPVATQIQQTLVNKTSQLRLRKRTGQEEGKTEVGISMPPRSRNNSSATNNSDTTTLVGIIDSSDVKRGIAVVRQRMREMSPWSRPESNEEDHDSREGSISLWKSTSTSVQNLVSQLETKMQGSKLAKSFTQPVNAHLSDAASGPAIDHDHDDNHEPHRDPDEPEPEPEIQALPKVAGKPVLAIQTHFDASVVSLLEYSKAIRAKSGYVLIAFDGAKKKLAAIQAARRRAELKKNIRVVGPNDKYPGGSDSHWV
ncbi:hypothetical protein UA08_06742 [Talaromyces atroroseus]|uniref:Uncharacterized protein n=1 Tax=Talaromyces atroroseus TaxID=1441469 RepID=A0A225AIG5_TALAT|nr:hypothetical protein UA08_06742 [Talaromyces atroroseus]OKL58034.1 hypothetical protein UA08_06742 [Talaromyces atroroseus]